VNRQWNGTVAELSTGGKTRFFASHHPGGFGLTAVDMTTRIKRESRWPRGIKELESLHRRTGRPHAKSTSPAGTRSGIVESRRMNHQLERAAIAESHRREVTHVACCQTTNVHRLGEGYDRTVYEAEVKIGEPPVHFHRS
jgi:hypothetical protein